MKTTDKRTCPVCNTLLDSNSEFCPVCALNIALESESHATSSDLRFEHYQILKNADGTPIELGHGAMGVTYKAIDVHLQCAVALKIINAQLIGDTSARHRFVREARAAASVHHQNVASVFHLGESGGDYFYVMEFVDGETLEKLIRRPGKLEVNLALEVISQVATGLTAIQKHHLVHRDIKPSNIMVTLEEGRLESVKIIDLGLAKGVVEQETISAVGSFTGRPGYASPEQFAGLGVDIRSDLYSLGITLWEMLLGKPPFQGSVTELMYQHQHTAVAFEQLKGVPAPIVALLNILLEKDPSRRFQGPLQLQRALAKVKEAVVSGSRISASELRTIANQTTDQSPTRPRRRRIGRWLIASTVSATALLLGWFFFVANRGPFFNRRSADSAATERSIAVLPFENISANKDDAYFADGVQDEILNNLAKIVQLKVISRTSVMQYRAEAKRNLRQIAADLGVGNVLEGTVRRDGNHVRVSTELVDARNDHTIWADSYDRDLTDIFAIQSEIAKAVASRLSAQLSPEERNVIEEKPTNNLEAYDLYLQAKQLLQANYWVLQKDEKGIYQRIISLLENATRKDSKFLLAYCLIAKAHDILYVDQIDHTPERRALGDAAVNEALRLRPDFPEAHLAMASHLYYCYRDFGRARVQIAMAAKGLSNNPEALELTALIDRVQGRWEESTTGLERATALDPRNPEVLGHLVDNYGRLRRYRDCEEIFNRLIVLDPDNPNFLLGKVNWIFAENADVKGARAACEAFPSSIKADPWVANWRFYYAACARDFSAAEKILDEIPNQQIDFLNALVPRQIVTLQLEFVQGNHPTMNEFAGARAQLCQKIEADPSNPWLVTVLALTDVALGRKDEGIQEGQRALEIRPISEDAFDGPGVARNVAIVYATADQLDAAFEQLNRLIQMPADPLSYGDLKTCPAWDPLRKDPRFDKLLAELAPKD